jgi:hypothetical protein
MSAIRTLRERSPGSGARAGVLGLGNVSRGVPLYPDSLVRPCAAAWTSNR